MRIVTSVPVRPESGCCDRMRTTPADAGLEAVEARATNSAANAIKTKPEPIIVLRYRISLSLLEGYISTAMIVAKPSSAAASGIDHHLAHWIVVDFLSQYPARQCGATLEDAVGSSAHVWLSHSMHLEAGSRNRRNRRRMWRAPAAPWPEAIPERRTRAQMRAAIRAARSVDRPQYCTHPVRIGAPPRSPRRHLLCGRNSTRPRPCR